MLECSTTSSPLPSLLPPHNGQHVRFFHCCISLCWTKPPGIARFGALFVGGWILQLVGHVFEGRRPALVDNLLQIFVAPIFLMAEVFFALGYKPEVRKRLSSSDRKASAAPSS